MRGVCVYVQVDTFECSETERENTPRCTRYAFQWAGYQRRIHPTFHVGMHLFFFFSSSVFLSFPVSFLLKFRRRTLKAHSYMQYPRKRRASGMHPSVAFYTGRTCRNERVLYFSAYGGLFCSFVNVLKETLILERKFA